MCLWVGVSWDISVYAPRCARGVSPKDFDLDLVRMLLAKRIIQLKFCFTQQLQAAKAEAEAEAKVSPKAKAKAKKQQQQLAQIAGFDCVN